MNKLHFCKFFTSFCSAVILLFLLNLTVLAADIFIQGTLNGENAPFIGVTVTLSGSVSQTTTTTSQGYYGFFGLPEGGNYTVTVASAADYRVSPSNYSLTNVTTNQTLNFTLTETCSAPNCRINGRIAFVRSGKIYSAKQDGTDERQLSNIVSGDSNPVYSPDGLKILFASTRDGATEIYEMNPDGSNVVRLTNNPAQDVEASYSSDGSKIIFASNRDGNYEIYTMNRNGTNQTRLTTTTENDRQPKFSPDGSKVVFSRQINSQTDSIYLMNADGANQTQLTNPSFVRDMSPIFSPNGEKILFTRFSNSSFTSPIYTVDLDGSNLNAILTASNFCYNPSFSPNGKRLIYAILLSSSYRIISQDINGNDERVHIANAQQPNWQPKISSSGTLFDFDGDSRSDISVFRPSAGNWFLQLSAAAVGIA